MLSIGQFARAAGLTSRALRLYDEVGLLSPADVDSVTGYRWYAASQLRAAELIRAGRSLEMPLAELRALLDDPPEEAHRRVDRHCNALVRRAAQVRSLAAPVHRLIDGTEVDQLDLQTIVFYVNDMSVAQHFYGELLGLPAVYERAGRTGYRLGPSRLLLHPRGEGLDRPMRAATEVNGNGIELSLGVDDVDVLLNRLRDNAITQ